MPGYGVSGDVGSLAFLCSGSPDGVKNLQTILETIPSAVVIVDADGKVAYVNKRARTLYGRDYAGAALASHMGKVKAQKPDGSSFSLDELPVSHSLKRGQVVRNVESIIQNADGVQYPVCASSAPLLDTEGRVNGAIVIFEDCSGHKQAEREMRSSEEKYRILFDSIDEGFCIIEVLFDEHERPFDYRFLEVNRSFERQTGLSGAAGRCIRDMVPSNEEHWFEIYGRVVLTGEPARFQNPAKALGRFYDVYAFRIGEPEQHRVAVLFDDITQHKRMEEALRESEERQAYILKLSDALRPLSDAQAIKDTATTLLAERLGASHASYNEYGEEDCFIQSEKRNDGGLSLVGTHKLSDFSAGVAVLQAGKALIVPDVAAFGAFPREQRERYFALNVRSFVTIPLVKENRLVASLSARHTAPHNWTPEEVDLVRETAERTWDAVERAHAKEALRKSEEKYRELIEQSAAGICEIDFRTGKFISVNDAMCKISGYSREELLGTTSFNMLDKESGQAVLRKMRQSMAGVKPEENFEYKIITKEGRPVEMLLNAKFKYNQKGEPIGATYIGNDITERKSAEEEISQQNAILQAINKVYEQSVSCATQQELGVQCLKIINALVGSKAELIGEVCPDGGLNDIAFNMGPGIAGIPNNMEAVRRVRETGCGGLYRSVIESAQPLLTNDPANHPDSTGVPEGHFKISSFLGVPFIQEGKVVGLIGVANKAGGFNERDKKMLQAITPSVLEVMMRKKAEEALRESEHKAVALVGELEEADKNKNQFLSVLSHELRNPLAAVAAGLSLIEMTDEKEQADKAKAIMRRQMNQLCKLVDDLLDLTRVTRNRIGLRREIIELGQVIRDAVNDIRPLLQSKNIHIVMRLVKQPVFLFADTVRINQCITNYLHNAMKFTPENGIIRVSLKKELGSAVITVRDNGIGITQGVLGQLFNPFVQADQSLDRTENGGLGLGLYIVKGIVELHGGTVSAGSAGLGKGAVFTMTLPIAEGSVHMERDTGTAKAEQAIRILIIEDNRDLAGTLCAILGFWGHEAMAVYDGRKGVQAAREMKPEIIFCDIGLPGISGYEAARSIRQDRALHDVFLVALTGYAGQADIERALESGFDMHLAKPVTAALMRQVLNKYKKKRGGQP